jgi:hypothetical protein
MSQYFDNKDSFLQPKVNQYGNHMIMTNVYKSTKTKYLNIDTRFRDDYDNYSQIVSGSQIHWFTFTLPESINNVKSVYVTNIEIPISFFNISAAFGNNVMTINNKLLTIPDGTYNPYSLNTAFQTAISGLLFEYIGVDIGANNFTYFINTGEEPVTLNFNIKPSNTCNNVTNPISTTTDEFEFDKFNFKSKLGWLLGFRDISYNISNGQVKKSENMYDLNNPKYLYLAIDEFTSGNQSSFISPMPMSIVNKNILARISLDYSHYAYGTIMPANQFNGLLLSDRRSYNGKVNLQKLKLQLVNEYGHSIDLNGLDFSFCLEIEYE